MQSSHVCSTNGESFSPTSASHASFDTSRTRGTTFNSNKRGPDLRASIFAAEDEPRVHELAALLRATDRHVRRDSAHDVDHAFVDEATELHVIRHDLGPLVRLLGRNLSVVDV